MDKDRHKPKRPRKDKFRNWTRREVSTCTCPDLSYRHSHCPRERCNGKAVSSSTEFHHWERNNFLAQNNDSSWTNESPDESSSDISDEESRLQSSTEGSGDEESILEENVCDVIDEVGGATNVAGLDSSGSPQPADDQNGGLGTSDNIKEEIVACILRGLILAEEMTSSMTDIEKLLQYAKDLYFKGDCNLEKYWPSNWRETERLLKDVGYENPQEFFICLDDSHYANYDIMDNKGSRCRFCGKAGAIKYYYLGLPQKVKLWCSDATFCQKMAKFWEEREHWLHHEGPWYPLKEVWDGARFSEVSWFWDPDCEWFLPTRCHFCSSVFSAEEIEGSPYDGHSYTVSCSDCGSVNSCKGALLGANNEIHVKLNKVQYTVKGEPTFCVRTWF